jgi:hypothetical protein
MAWRDSRGGIERGRRRHLDARRRRACGGLSERSWPCGCWALGAGCWKTVGLDRPVAACNTSAGHSAIHGHDHGVNMFRPGSIPRERLRSRFLGHRGGRRTRATGWRPKALEAAVSFTSGPTVEPPWEDDRGTTGVPASGSGADSGPRSRAGIERRARDRPRRGRSSRDALPATGPAWRVARR